MKTCKQAGQSRYINVRVISYGVGGITPPQKGVAKRELETFSTSADQDQTAQNVQSDLVFKLSCKEISLLPQVNKLFNFQLLNK